MLEENLKVPLICYKHKFNGHMNTHNGMTTNSKCNFGSLHWHKQQFSFFTPCTTLSTHEKINDMCTQRQKTTITIHFCVCMCLTYYTYCKMSVQCTHAHTHTHTHTTHSGPTAEESRSLGTVRTEGMCDGGGMPAPGTIRPFSLEGTPAKDLQQSPPVSIVLKP